MGSIIGISIIYHHTGGFSETGAQEHEISTFISKDDSVEISPMNTVVQRKSGVEADFTHALLGVSSKFGATLWTCKMLLRALFEWISHRWFSAVLPEFSCFSMSWRW